MSLVVISQGSRRLALIPLLFLAGRTVAGRELRAWKISLAALAALYLMPLPLAFRSLVSHGAVPHLNSLAGYVSSQPPWEPIAANLLFGFPLAAQVALHQPPISMNAFIVSVNPLPGGLAGWYDISRSLRLNEFTPYSALGELSNQGPLAVIFYCLSLGIAMTWSSRMLLGSVGQHASSLLRTLFISAGAGFIALSFLQYNLRSTTRVVYMMMALAIASLIPRLFSHHRYPR
jgi:hypothetical protein